MTHIIDNHVERYVMSREDAERVKATAENIVLRDAAAQILALMDEKDSAIASAVRQERENIRPELYHVIIESGVGSYQVRDAIANKVDAAVRKEREAHCTIIENMAEGYKFAGHTDEAIALYDVVATLRARSEATK